MDFRKNNEGLGELFNLYGAFLVGNDTGTFKNFVMGVDPDDMLAKNTLEHGNGTGEIHGVLAGSNAEDPISLITGNSVSSRDRAKFLAMLLENWPVFFGWMKSWIEVRESGFVVTRRGDGKWFAVGPSFQSLEESPSAVAETPQAAMGSLTAQLDNEPLLGAEWTPEKRMLGYGVGWRYARVPDRASKEPGAHLMQITGRWVRPGTRHAVKASTAISLDASPEDIATAKRGLIENLWDNREKAGRR